MICITRYYGVNFNYTCRENFNALYFACNQSNNLECIKFLIDIGIKINVMSAYGCTPLSNLCTYPNNLEYIEYLVDHGGDINDSMLYNACQLSNNLESIKYLIEIGINVKYTNKQDIWNAAIKTDDKVVIGYLQNNFMKNRRFNLFIII